MIDIIATRSGSRLTARLDVAVDGRGAISRFRRVLDDRPLDRTDWIELSAERRVRHARGR